MMNWREALGPHLSADVEWPAPADAPIPVSQMAAAFGEAKNLVKMAHWIPIYDNLFRSYRLRAPKVLEIGVAMGGSLDLWRRYFSHSTIVGIDGDRQCARHDDPTRDLHVRIGMQQDTEFLQKVIEEFGPFDIVIDDGGHLPTDTLASFRKLFTDGLSDGGLYIVEDLEWCYMPCGREPLPNNPRANDGSPTFTDFCKMLIDVMHTHYEIGATTDAFSADLPGHLKSITVPRIATMLGGFQMYDGMVALHRQNRDTVPYMALKTDLDELAEWLGFHR